jgi:hypothetical protein
MANAFSRHFVTDKIGFASFLVIQGKTMTGVQVKTRNRALFCFDLDEDEASSLEVEYTRSDFNRFFEAFKFLRDKTIRGAN